MSYHRRPDVLLIEDLLTLEGLLIEDHRKQAFMGRKMGCP